VGSRSISAELSTASGDSTAMPVASVAGGDAALGDATLHYHDSTHEREDTLAHHTRLAQLIVVPQHTLIAKRRRG
jgi:hypothetical protein